MPTIKDFGGFYVRMFFADHNPPHVHVVGADFAALVAIKDGALIKGEIPSAVAKVVLPWIVENSETLMKKWNEWS